VVEHCLACIKPWNQSSGKKKGRKEGKKERKESKLGRK
jgi:hypothetical protein